MKKILALILSGVISRAGGCLLSVAPASLFGFWGLPAQGEELKEPLLNSQGPKAQTGVSGQIEEPSIRWPSFRQNLSVESRAYELLDRAANERVKGNYGQAVNYMVEACQILRMYLGDASPLLSRLYFDLGSTASQAGLNEIAQDYFAKFCLENPRSIEGQLELANIYARRGKFQEALEAANKAVALDPREPRAHLIRGLILERCGLPAEGKEESQRALDLVDSLRN